MILMMTTPLMVVMRSSHQASNSFQKIKRIRNNPDPFLDQE